MFYIYMCLWVEEEGVQAGSTVKVTTNSVSFPTGSWWSSSLHRSQTCKHRQAGWWTSAAPGPWRDFFPADRQSSYLEPKLSLTMRTEMVIGPPSRFIETNIEIWNKRNKEKIRNKVRKAGFNTCAVEVSKVSVGKVAVFSILISSAAWSVFGGGAELYMAGAATKPCTFTGNQRVTNFSERRTTERLYADAMDANSPPTLTW